MHEEVETIYFRMEETCCLPTTSNALAPFRSSTPEYSPHAEPLLAPCVHGNFDGDSWARCGRRKWLAAVGRARSLQAAAIRRTGSASFELDNGSYYCEGAATRESNDEA